MFFGHFEKEASIKLATHQTRSMQPTSRIAHSLGLVFSINHQPLARPWSLDMHLSARAGTSFNPSEPVWPRDVRRLCNYSNRISPARYTHFIL